MSEKQEDIHLVGLLQKGDVTSFDLLFEKYSSKLYGFALKYFKNETDAEELVQEVFVKVWENHQSLKSASSFKSYLFTIALNQIRKHFNQKVVVLRYIENIQNNSAVADQVTHDEYENTLHKIYQIINKMPQRRREIFLKSKIEGKCAKDVAAELNISPGTVDNQISEALRFIRNHLKNENIGLSLFVILFLF
jgi:RNA polymerase sigma-70 factor (family 1)